MYRGSLQDFYWKKDTHKIIDVICPHFNLERLKMRKYMSNILKRDAPSGDMKENIDHWLDSFENFHQKYIIMKTEPYNYSVPEESICIAVRTPSGFINQENETRCYFNATIQDLVQPKTSIFSTHTLI